VLRKEPISLYQIDEEELATLSLLSAHPDLVRSLWSLSCKVRQLQFNIAPDNKKLSARYCDDFV
jgi:hypothetical protein